MDADGVKIPPPTHEDNKAADPYDLRAELFKPECNELCYGTK